MGPVPCVKYAVENASAPGSTNKINNKSLANNIIVCYMVHALCYMLYACTGNALSLIPSVEYPSCLQTT